VGGLPLPQINPAWRTAAILNKKLLYRQEHSAYVMLSWCTL